MTDNTNDKDTPKREDVKVIGPDFSLKTQLGDKKVDDLIKNEKLQSAQMAIKHTISKEKDTYLDRVCTLLSQLETIYDILNNTQDHANSYKYITKIQAVATDLKNNAALMGFPLAAKVAESLHGLCSRTNEIDQQVLALLDAHNKTLTAIFSNAPISDGNADIKTLLKDIGGLKT